MLEHQSPAAPPSRRLPDVWIALTLALGTFALFWGSPVRTVADSWYTLLVSEQLLRNQSFELTEYFSPHVDSSGYPGVASGRWPRHVQPLGVRHGDRRGIEGPLYYIYPPGSSLLSAPAVWIANRFGVSLVDPANRYQERLEVHLQTLLAAGLMAVATGIFYLVSRLYVGGGWSLAIATWGAVGTSIWSTASRGLWSHTWDVLLLALAILHLSRVEARSGRLAPIWLATLLSWGYVVRPTAIFYIGPLVLYETSNRQPTARRPR